MFGPLLALVGVWSKLHICEVKKTQPRAPSYPSLADRTIPMKQLSFFFSRPQPFLASLLYALFFTLLWAACGKTEEADLSLHFPQTFTVHDLAPGFAKVYRQGEGGNRVELTREQAGTFTAFLDTMASYTELDKMQLNFTGLEFLDPSRVRIFSDGSLGIPAFDTIAGYSKRGANVISYITVDWMLLGAPMSLALGDIKGQYLALSPVWFAYTYRPFMPPFQIVHVPVRQIYSTYNVIVDVFDALDPDYGKGDTLAIHYESLHFR